MKNEGDNVVQALFAKNNAEKTESEHDKLVRLGFREIVITNYANGLPTKPTKESIDKATSFLVSSNRMGALSPSIDHAVFIGERIKQILSEPKKLNSSKHTRRSPSRKKAA